MAESGTPIGGAEFLFKSGPRSRTRTGFTSGVSSVSRFASALRLQRGEGPGVAEERAGLWRSQRRLLAARAERNVELRDLRQAQGGYDFGFSDVGVELAAVDTGAVAERAPNLVWRLEGDYLLAWTRSVDPDPRFGPRTHSALADIDGLRPDRNSS